MKDLQQNETSTALIAALEVEGYTIRETMYCLKKNCWNKPSWNASHTKRGVRIAIIQIRDSIQCTVKLRTKIGNFKLAATFNIKAQRNSRLIKQKGEAPIEWVYQCGYVGSYLRERGLAKDNKSNHFFQWKLLVSEDFFNWIRQISGEEATQKLRLKADLKPLHLGKDSLKIKDGVISVRHFFRSCSCVDIVAINDKLQVTQEGIIKPNAKCWFLIKGNEIITGYQVTIIINSDIDRFHPLVRRNTKKFKGLQVTNNLRPDNGKIDYNVFSVLDQQAIRLAIETYLDS